MNGNSPQPPVKLVQSYRRHPPPQIIPVITSFASSSAPESPVTTSPSSVSTQPSLRAAKRTKWHKIDDVLQTYGFPNVGDFLACLFHPRVRGEKDHRTQHHKQAVGTFLHCKCTVKMAGLIKSLYHHHKSRPKKDSGSRRRHLRATTNGLLANTDVVTWEDTEFMLQGLARQYQDEDPFVWYLTECFAASRKKGKVTELRNTQRSAMQKNYIRNDLNTRDT
jgi:hypothetical protein